jgi:hypothetical protein
MLKVIALIAIVFVVVILGGGLYTLWAGGDVARTWSNRLMRLRVLAQFIAILLLMLILYISQQHH